MKFVGGDKGVVGNMFGTGALATLKDETRFICCVWEGRSKRSGGMIWMMRDNCNLGDGTEFTLGNGTCNNFGDSGYGGISIGAFTIGDVNSVRRVWKKCCHG